MACFRHLVFIVGLCLFSAQTAYAMQENASGWPAYSVGEFEAAMEQSARDDTADGYALACRSAIVLGGFQRKGPEAVQLLHKGIRFCEKALEKDPQHLIGLMTYAMSIAYEGKRKKSPKLGKTALGLLEEVRDLYPNAPETHAAVAGWHSEVRAAGFFARMLMRPKKAVAEKGFAHAAKNQMTHLPLLLEYAKFLARDKKRWAQARDVLNTIATQASSDGFDDIVKNFARKIDDALARKNKSAVKQAIKEATAFRGIGKVKGIDTIDLRHAAALKFQS